MNTQLHHDGDAPVFDPEREETNLGPVLPGDLTISRLPAADSSALTHRRMMRGSGWLAKQMRDHTAADIAAGRLTPLDIEQRAREHALRRTVAP